MKKILLNKTLIAGAVMLAATGCEEVGEGKDYGFYNSNQVVYAEEKQSYSYDEESGSMTIDLLVGSSVNGTALNVDTFGSAIYIREFQFSPRNTAFVTPQVPGFAANQSISPFSLDETGTKLVVNTDQFADAIRMCDDTDERGGLNADGEPILPDGVRDFPQSITYDISYIVDVGYEQGVDADGNRIEPEQQTISLTINAITDGVIGVNAPDFPVAAGGTATVGASTIPTYACNQALTYEVSTTGSGDATIDADGVATGTGTGTVTYTATSVDNPQASASGEITVTGAFSIAITNDDKDEFDASTGTKLVPACTPIGVEVLPAVVNDSLTGEYTFDWQSANADVAFVNEETAAGFAKTGRFSNALEAGESAEITVDYDTGYTGATAASAIDSQSITVTAERNYVCDPELNSVGTQWYVNDFGFNFNTGPAWGGPTAVVADDLMGNAMQVTIPAAGWIEAQITQAAWNNTANYFSYTFGRVGVSAGKKFKFGVWAKLNQLPADANAELTITHTLLPWLFEATDGTGFSAGASTGGGSYTNYPDRYTAPGVPGKVSATLKHTTDWQYVELINPLTGTQEWSVPATWAYSTPTFQFWDFSGFAENDVVLIDGYSIVEVTD